MDNDANALLSLVNAATNSSTEAPPPGVFHPNQSAANADADAADAKYAKYAKAAATIEPNAAAASAAATAAAANASAANAASAARDKRDHARSSRVWASGHAREDPQHDEERRTGQPHGRRAHSFRTSERPRPEQGDRV